MLNEDKYAFVPILRAGTGMLEGITTIIPNAKIGHIGLYRNEETLEPIKYYREFMDHYLEQFAEGRIPKEQIKYIKSSLFLYLIIFGEQKYNSRMKLPNKFTLFSFFKAIDKCIQLYTQ